MDNLSNARAMQTATGKSWGSAPPLFNPPQDYFNSLQDYLRPLFFRVSRDLYSYLGMRRNIYRDHFRNSRCWAEVRPCYIEASAQHGGII